MALALAKLLGNLNLKENMFLQSQRSSCSADPLRFRFTHQTSVVKRHVGLPRTIGIRWILETRTCHHGDGSRDPEQNYQATKNFWFNRIQWIVFLIHLTLFEINAMISNAFQMAHFLWTWLIYAFNLRSCFYESSCAATSLFHYMP
ncbi:unnamed protein product [Musa acuminata subsp. malaccensis]|uniref:(wild Malaysian banana) hypothetical protein n=1 Tax=Musa acuminata subsp. malaccensis TaxID=214687 RepID=A0A804LA07_MUSAM|nr:unnamed protein product [Musa acuminata subsp. malaccensis]